ncbi:MAG: molybdenum cofactor biosynthesis protein MoaE [Candidatus Hydrogenedentota bacterium]
MKVKLLFFGIYKIKTNLENLVIDLKDGARLCDIESFLYNNFGQIFNHNTPILFSVNQEYVSDKDYIIPENAEVGIMPPLSGGNSDFFYQITDKPIRKFDIEYPADCGATFIFDGSVRDIEDNKKIDTLYYDIYTEMAQKKFEELLSEVKDKYPGIKTLQIIHRAGKIKVSEVALRIIIQSPHRAESFQALEYTINRIKEIIPIFKVNYIS